MFQCSKGLPHARVSPRHSKTLGAIRICCTHVATSLWTSGFSKQSTRKDQKESSSHENRHCRGEVDWHVQEPPEVLCILPSSTRIQATQMEASRSRDASRTGVPIAPRDRGLRWQHHPLAVRFCALPAVPARTMRCGSGRAAVLYATGG